MEACIAAIDAAREDICDGNPLAAQQRLEALLCAHDDSVRGWNMLGQARVDQALWDSAEDAFWQVVRLMPNSWGCWFNLLVCASRGKRPEAMVAGRYRVLEAVVLGQPGQPEEERASVIARAARLLKDFGPPAVAETAARRWSALGGGENATLALALSLNRQKKFESAVPIWRQLVEQRPEEASFFGLLGEALAGCQQFDEAVACFRQSLARDAENTQIMRHLADALQYCGDHEEGDHWLARVIELNPEATGAIVARGMQRLRAGQYAQGYADYEQRLAIYAPGSGHYQQVYALRDLGVPLWQGEPLQGKRLFVCPEQGLGDFIMCVRLLPMLQRFAPASIAFGCPSGLKRYADALPFGDIRCMETVGSTDADYYIPLMSLMQVLGLSSEEDIPPPLAPKLAPDMVRLWRTRLKAPVDGVPTTCAIGLAWRGNATHPADRFRSIGMEAFIEGVVRPLAQQKGIRLVSVQRDIFDDEERRLAEYGVQTTWIGSCTDIFDTANLVSGLDAMLCVDTALTHLAATLGIPTFMLNRVGSAADWRWLKGRSDSPWYSSIRILSQQRILEWKPVMAQAVQAVLDIRPGEPSAAGFALGTSLPVARAAL